MQSFAYFIHKQHTHPPNLPLYKVHANGLICGAPIELITLFALVPYKSVCDHGGAMVANLI